MKNEKIKNNYRINEQIRSREVRLVGDDVESTVMPTHKAIQLAEQKGVDLVEISPNAQPPVCRLIDYSKFLYQQKKRQKELKAKQVKIEVKEIRFGPQTDEHDYNFKLKHAKDFLTEGDKVKAYVFFRGRSILFKEQGEVLLLRFANDLEEYGKVEQMPVLEGKRMIIFIFLLFGFLRCSNFFRSDENNPASNKAEKVKVAPAKKTQKEYTGPKVEGEDF